MSSLSHTHVLAPYRRTEATYTGIVGCPARDENSSEMHKTWKIVEEEINTPNIHYKKKAHA